MSDAGDPPGGCPCRQSARSCPRWRGSSAALGVNPAAVHRRLRQVLPDQRVRLGRRARQVARHLFALHVHLHKPGGVSGNDLELSLFLHRKILLVRTQPTPQTPYMQDSQRHQQICQWCTAMLAYSSEGPCNFCCAACTIDLQPARRSAAQTNSGNSELLQQIACTA